MTYPLAGTIVLDLSRLFPGAYCSRQLADLGARIIKVEEPGVGDFYCEQPLGKAFSEEMIAAFNRGKESLSLNLKSEEGRKILWRLIKKVDVLLEGFRPGALARLGFSYQKIKKVNPRLILCSLSGYGQTGPRAQEAGHDLNYISVAGLLDSPDGNPAIPPFQIADLAGGGLFGAMSILAALFQREKTGRGTWIDLAVAEGAVSLASPYLTDMRRDESSRGAYELLSGGAASYQLYRTKDEKWVALAPLENKFWQNFQSASASSFSAKSGMDRAVFSAAVKRRLVRIMRGRTLAQWLRRTKKTDLCLTPVHAHRAVLREPQFAARRLFFRQRLGGKRWGWGFKSPFVFNRRRLYRSERAPRIGEHNRAILSELGYHPVKIRKFKKQGIL